MQVVNENTDDADWTDLYSYKMKYFMALYIAASSLGGVDRLIFDYQSATFFRASLSAGSFSAASFKAFIILSVLFSTGASVVRRS